MLPTSFAGPRGVVRDADSSRRLALAISDDVVVSLHYRLTREDGTLVEEYGGEPTFEYLHGAGNIVRGLEEALAGRRAGDRLKLSLLPDEAYGYPRDDFVRTVPRSAFPRDAELRPGLRFGSEVDGVVLPAWVDRVDEEMVTVNFNPPLAGETLRFDVQVVEVRNAFPSELAQGCPCNQASVAVG